MKTIDIALAQLSPRLRETKTNLETVRSVVAERPEAGLIVFPELFLSGYTVTNVDELAILPSGPELQTLAEIAQENSTALIIGAAERLSNGVANSAFCVDEHGNIAAVYRKFQSYGGDEGDAFVAGDELLVVELCGIKVGIMICFDMEFPEIARALAREGAEMLVTISANMEPFGNDHAVFASARALENGLPHAYVNQVGPGDKGLIFTGGSSVISADGELCAQADSSRETVVNAKLSLSMKSNIREDYLNQLRSPLPEVRNLPYSTRSKKRSDVEAGTR